jgi:hypothetical protein
MTHSAVGERSDVAISERIRAVGYQVAGRWFWPVNGIILAVQALACILLLRRSYFFAEDFTYLQVFRHRPVGLDLLTQPVFGHLTPGFLLVQKYFGQWWGANWPLAAVLTVLVQVAGTVAFARLMLALVGRTWWSPLVTAAFGLSVIVLNTSQWWAATTTIQVALACCVSTWGCALRYADSRRLRHLVSLAVMFGLAAAFWEKTIAECAFLGLFALLVGVGERHSSSADRLRSTLRLWPVWAVMGAIAAAVLVVYATGDFLGKNGTPASTGQTLDYVVRSYTEGLFPALLGVAYPVTHLPGPAAMTPVVATAAVLVLVTWTCARSPLARRAWAWFFLANLLSQLLVARGRLSIMGTDVVAHNLRYQLDALFLFLVALAVAVPAAVVADRSRRSVLAWRRVGVAGLAVGIALVPMWAYSLRSISDESPGVASRKFFSGLWAGDYPREQPFLDLPLPGWIIPPEMFPWNTYRTVFRLTSPGTKVTTEPEGSLMIKSDGTVTATSLQVVQAPDTHGEVCARPTDRRRHVVVSERPTSDVQPLLVEVAYRAPKAGTVQLWAHSDAGLRDLRAVGSSFPVHAGRGRLVASLSTNDWDDIRLGGVVGTELCVTSAQLVTPSA